MVNNQFTDTQEKRAFMVKIIFATKLINGNGRKKCDKKYASDAPHEGLQANTENWKRYFEVMDSIQVL
tara:strand:+ start:1935 stop:2138 length:204 start_codon:yes stop_codon:yes gene_type:complete